MSETFCILPWIHLATHPNGGVSLCCRSNHTNAMSWAKDAHTQELLQLGTNSINQIANSRTFLNVRTSLLSGKKPIECEGCWRDEKVGIESKRQFENKRWNKIIPLIKKESVIDNIDYRYVELRLGNVCNNACITCNSFSSTKWYKDEEKISKELSWFKLRTLENFKWFENHDFYNELLTHSNNLEEIYINGGEPTLIRQHYDFLRSLIKLDRSKHITLVYSLNLMDIPNDLLEIWKNYKTVVVNASIDDIEERNFYIRYPTKWNQVLFSLDKLNRQSNIDWHVTQTVSVLNVHNLDKLYQWLFHNYKKEPHHNYVLYPTYLSLASLPKFYKDMIKDSLKGKLPLQKENDLFSKLSIPYDNDCHKKCKEFLNALDKVRNLVCKDYIPELEKIL